MAGTEKLPGGSDCSSRPRQRVVSKCGPTEVSRPGAKCNMKYNQPTSAKPCSSARPATGRLPTDKSDSNSVVSSNDKAQLATNSQRAKMPTSAATAVPKVEPIQTVQNP